MITGTERPLTVALIENVKRKGTDDDVRESKRRVGDEPRRRVGDFGGDPKLDEAKLLAALEAENLRLQGKAPDRKYNSIGDNVNVTEEVGLFHFSCIR